LSAVSRALRKALRNSTPEIFSHFASPFSPSLPGSLSHSYARAWENSEERRRWLDKSRPLLDEEEKVHVLTGLETWFTLPSKLGEPAPPRYKMVIVTWLGVFPIVTIIFSLFDHWLNLLPTLVRTLVFSAVMVTLMTYMVMPRLTRLFSFWLYPDRE
jgi:uncharacterized protein